MPKKKIDPVSPIPDQSDKTWLNLPSDDVLPGKEEARSRGPLPQSIFDAMARLMPSVGKKPVDKALPWSELHNYIQQVSPLDVPNKEAETFLGAGAVSPNMMQSLNIKGVTPEQMQTVQQKIASQHPAWLFHSNELFFGQWVVSMIQTLLL